MLITLFNIQWKSWSHVSDSTNIRGTQRTTSTQMSEGKEPYINNNNEGHLERLKCVYTNVKSRVLCNTLLCLWWFGSNILVSITTQFIFKKFKYIYETSKNYTVWATLTCILISVTPDHSLTPLVTWLAFVAPKQRLWHRKKGGKEAGRQPTSSNGVGRGHVSDSYQGRDCMQLQGA